ncbi:ABC transporter substrate-binding protein [Pseudodesulfovibrio sp.]|uniref:ABC transporter substrate-binding protein n=1 Tax=Pseudodesulfovibrio sp. TaxID=2035812 RepID=UPI00260D0C18|nr:ABC transporter substrate-binding protein [Pseudodesulfovibrio sp.]MDD3313308.1 ABC transporter substrate-binding protein [Pseudodesulfovibrio sp.]
MAPPFRAHIVILLAALLASLSACSDSSPIVIGFSGQLTGKLASLGVPARNGAQLAIEIINRQGGVNGRSLQLLARDDGNTPEKALMVDRELVGAGAVAVIGHITGSQTKAVFPYFEENGIVLIAPLDGPPELTGKKDQFFQISSDQNVQAGELANYANMALNIKTVVIVTETDYADYTLPLAKTFARNFNQVGGKVLTSVTYSTKSSMDWETVIQRLIVLQPQAVLLFCPAYDAVSLIQTLNTNRLDMQVFIGSWPYSEILLRWGGPAVEGVVLALDYAEDNPNPEFIKFREAYRHRFGENPNHAAGFGYEAVLALAAALQTTKGRAEGLADALSNGRSVPGVVSKFTFNEYGDAKRNMFIITVLDGKFSTINVR